MELRISELRNYYRLTKKDFGKPCGLSAEEVDNIERGAQPGELALIRIARIYGTTTDWLTTGNGEMLPAGKKEIYQNEAQINNWKEEAYQNVKEQSFYLQKKIEMLWKLIEFFMSTELDKKQISFPEKSASMAQFQRMEERLGR